MYAKKYVAIQVTHLYYGISIGKNIKLKFIACDCQKPTDAEFGSTVKLCGVSAGMSESVRTLMDSSGPGPFYTKQYLFHISMNCYIKLGKLYLLSMLPHVLSIQLA